MTTIDHNYYKWNIYSGDYYRDYDTSYTYFRKVLLKKRVIKLAKILLYMGMFFSLLVLLMNL
jgi:hypothetical protein